jgi:hypothetical protein
MWWACSQPERPHDEDAAYEDDCRACALHLAVAIRIGLLPPETTFYRSDDDGVVIECTTAGEVLERYG